MQAIDDIWEAEMAAPTAVEDATVTTLTTTRYDFMTVVQDAMPGHDEALILATVIHLLDRGTGRRSDSAQLSATGVYGDTACREQ